MKMMIDRFEGNYAVVELPDKSIWNVPRAFFPGAAEGDVYTISKDGSETTKRKHRIQSKFDRMKRE